MGVESYVRAFGKLLNAPMPAEKDLGQQLAHRYMLDALGPSYVQHLPVATARAIRKMFIADARFDRSVAVIMNEPERAGRYGSVLSGSPRLMSADERLVVLTRRAFYSQNGTGVSIELGNAFAAERRREQAKRRLEAALVHVLGSALAGDQTQHGPLAHTLDGADGAAPSADEPIDWSALVNEISYWRAAAVEAWRTLSPPVRFPATDDVLEAALDTSPCGIRRLSAVRVPRAPGRSGMPASNIRLPAAA
ncbi:hypothetical protein [Streptomyces sp. NPDC056308]|uniref:hypothetical protein n=1 Tax=Streptomyces sp. NPDC056308 TaxID=3345780 RepID=UPI0035D94A44